MLLKTLSELNGTSGDESLVRNFLAEEIKPYVEKIIIDKLGNLLAFKNQNSSGPKVMLSAHMDEVALMITAITNEGCLKFRPVGGIDARILVSKTVSTGAGVKGVIGAKAIHLQKAAEREKAYTYDQLYIDIGAQSKEEAAGKIQIGDFAYLGTACESFGDGLRKGKAFDDRVGCAILVDLLKQEYDFPLTAAFTVQEEVGLRGAKVAAYQLEPDFAVVVEGTIAADVMEREEEEWVTELGKGPACSVIDNRTLYSPKLIRHVAEVARKNNIPLQFRRGASGGNDAGQIHLTKTGIPTLSLSVPCRYIHSWVSVIAEKDFHSCFDLVLALLRNLPALKNYPVKTKEEQ
jgi:endoglucanase